MSKKIPLSRGQFAIVDDQDFEALSKHHWHAIWKKSNQSFYAARTVYQKLSTGYKKTTIYMAIEILKPKSGFQVDHKNHNTLDNRRINLRIATRSQNSTNAKYPVFNKTGFRGVWQKKNRYRAQIKINGIHVHLGSFQTPQEASAAYQEAAKKYHGEFRFQGIQS